eukprot:NODE_1368_length_611_cov_224.366803_g1356_i0.p1 GENE.NODE_1368_length_611_cov_224.366803_g1356_i0~~NODE_1368_length_611_cov_224.366803_g1356_i0.p1  ORF type:complete len:176 (-),score=40.81 NODE_1368_length_611_cov_224.366803_g1356_i0:82-552(-)
MGRHLLTCDLLINGVPAMISTVHLESLHEEELRQRQLQYIFPVLKKRPVALLCGDFNFCSKWRKEQANLDPAFVDVWGTLRPDAPGWTEDTDINFMRFDYTGRKKQVRFDRVLWKAPGAAWRPTSIDLLGTSPVDAEHPRIFPSDHFGLVADFVIE